MGDRPVAHTVVIPTPPGICGRGRTASLPALTGMTPLWQPGILRKDWQFVKRWNLILGLVVLFLSGVLVGALGTAIYFKQAMGHTFGESQPAIRKLVMKKLVRELDLTEPKEPGSKKSWARCRQNCGNFASSTSEKLKPFSRAALNR